MDRDSYRTKAGQLGSAGGGASAHAADLAAPRAVADFRSHVRQLRKQIEDAMVATEPVGNDEEHHNDPGAKQRLRDAHVEARYWTRALEDAVPGLVMAVCESEAAQ